jgi:hypothetical protein
MHQCSACNKYYSNAYNLKKHLKRQPLCEEWLKLQPGIKDYIDDKFNLPLSDIDKKNLSHKCFICNTTFANLGNLNRHLDNNIQCSKWALYKDLIPLETYIKQDNSEFVPPEYTLHHIIWNVFLIDKEYLKLDNFKKILKDNNIKCIIALLPFDESSAAQLTFPGVDKIVMNYHDHTPFLDYAQFDSAIEAIEKHRKNRENVFVFCNNGYQRSLPFLSYYLVHHHAEEIPNIERAIDIILPQVDKANYIENRAKYIDDLEKLFTSKSFESLHFYTRAREFCNT